MAEQTKELKLFRVSTRVPEYHGCKDVCFHWFRDWMEAERCAYYPELIVGYDPKHKHAAYAENVVEEMFTEAEADQLKAYLDAVHGDVTTITEHCRPICLNENHIEIGLGAIPVGGPQDYYMLYREREYTLPFKVLGYFDLRGLEEVDRSGTYHGYRFVLDRDCMHKVENAPPELKGISGTELEREYDPLVTIETSCGMTIRQRPGDMTDWQLVRVLEANDQRTDVNPLELAAMRDELKRRRGEAIKAVTSDSDAETNGTFGTDGTFVLLCPDAQPPGRGTHGTNA
jgi:hypothetical protein